MQIQTVTHSPQGFSIHALRWPGGDRVLFDKLADVYKVAKLYSIPIQTCMIGDVFFGAKPEPGDSVTYMPWHIMGTPQEHFSKGRGQLPKAEGRTLLEPHRLAVAKVLCMSDLSEPTIDKDGHLHVPEGCELTFSSLVRLFESGEIRSFESLPRRKPAPGNFGCAEYRPELSSFGGWQLRDTVSLRSATFNRQIAQFRTMWMALEFCRDNHLAFEATYLGLTISTSRGVEYKPEGHITRKKLALFLSFFTRQLARPAGRC